MSAPNIPYNFDLVIDYSNHPNTNAYYRKTLRELFFMDVEITPDLASLDEETRDELLYDESTVAFILQLLFEATYGDVLFQELYDLAAAVFISTDRTIGQAVLFSYDYLPLFHLCIKDFFREPASWNHRNTHFLRLKTRLS